MKLALRRILVATDFSDESRAALAYGAALARTFNASLHVLHVLQAVVTPDPERSGLTIAFRDRQWHCSAPNRCAVRMVLPSQLRARWAARESVALGIRLDHA